MTYEELRLKRNEAYLKYLKCEETTEKMRLLNWWKDLSLAAEDAFKQEINN